MIELNDDSEWSDLLSNIVSDDLASDSEDLNIKNHHREQSSTTTATIRSSLTPAEKSMFKSLAVAKGVELNVLLCDYKQNFRCTVDEFHFKATNIKNEIEIALIAHHGFHVEKNSHYKSQEDYKVVRKLNKMKNKVFKMLFVEKFGDVGIVLNDQNIDSFNAIFEANDNL